MALVGSIPQFTIVTGIAWEMSYVWNTELSLMMWWVQPESSSELYDCIAEKKVFGLESHRLSKVFAIGCMLSYVPGMYE